MLRRHARGLFVVALAVGLLTAVSAAPVAADGGIGLGGDDAIEIEPDGVSVGGEDGVSVGVDPEEGADASAGGDEGVTVDADDDGVEVSAAGESVETDDPGDGVTLPDDELEGTEVDESAPVDGDVEDVDPAAADLPADEVGMETVADDLDGGLGDADVPTDPTGVDVDTDDATGDASPPTQTLPALPESDQVGPGAVPVGDEDAPVNVCDPLAVESDDLPVGLAPGVDDLPDEAAPPGVPADILTTEAVVGILLGVVPGPCEVATPNDPQVDPTDPPADPRGQADVVRFGEYDDGAVALVFYDGTLDDGDDAPAVSGMSGLLVTPEYGDVDQELVVDDGRNGYGADPRFRYNEDGTEYEAVLLLLGKQAGVEGACEDLRDYDGDLSLDPGTLEENPLGPCEYQLVGLPNLFGPGDLAGVLTDLENRDEPPVDVDALPVNPDALLNR